MKFIRNLPDVNDIFMLDSETEIIIHETSIPQFEQLCSEFPNLFTIRNPVSYRIDVLSSEMVNNGAYMKKRYYLNKNLQLVKEF